MHRDRSSRSAPPSSRARRQGRREARDRELVDFHSPVVVGSPAATVQRPGSRKLMATRSSRVAGCLGVLLVALSPAWSIAADEKVDLATIHRIKEEAFKHSK